MSLFCAQSPGPTVSVILPRDRAVVTRNTTLSISWSCNLPSFTVAQIQFVRASNPKEFCGSTASCPASTLAAFPKLSLLTPAFLVLSTVGLLLHHFGPHHSIYRVFEDLPSICRTPVPKATSLKERDEVPGWNPAGAATVSRVSSKGFLESGPRVDTALDGDGETIINTMYWSVPWVSINNVNGLC